MSIQISKYMCILHAHARPFQVRNLYLFIIGKPQDGVKGTKACLLVLSDRLLFYFFS